MKDIIPTVTLIFWNCGLFLMEIFVSVPAVAQVNSGQGWQIVNTLNLPAERMENAFVKVGGKFYLVGGLSSEPVHEYDPSTNQWTQKGASVNVMNHFQAIVYNDLIWVLGGFTGAGQTPMSYIHVYDPAQDLWSVYDTIPVNRRRGAAGAVLYNNEIYLLCGIQNGHTNGWVPWVDKYNPATKTWTTLSDAPQTRDHIYVSLAEDNIYLIGGRRTINGSINTTIPEVELYNISSNTWTVLPPSSNVPTERSGAPTILVGNEILLVGGETAGQSSAHNETEAFNISTGTWRTLPNLAVPRHATTMLIHDNYVYIAAGSSTRGAGSELASMERLHMAELSTAPVVSIVEPVNNTVFDPNPTIEITASASDNNGTVIKVEFFAGNLKIGEVASSPFTITWAEMDTGTYALTAVAMDNDSNTTLSDVVHIMVGCLSGSVLDCNDDCNGTAFINACSLCVEGNTGLPADHGGVDCLGVCGGTAIPDDCGICEGTNSTCCELLVTDFILVESGTFNDIRTLEEGDVLNKMALGSFSIRVELCTNPVGSVIFFLDGEMLQTENNPPYAIAADDASGYFPWNPDEGNYTVEAIPYSSSNGGGIQGVGKTINLTVIDQDEDCNGDSGGSAVIDDCGVCAGGNTGVTPNADEDCNGECFGTAVLDCNGVCNGPAVMDSSGVCCPGGILDCTGQCATSAADCDDHDPCTIDICDGGICLHTDTCCVEQIIILNSGWNMVSSYIIPDNPAMEDIFSEISSEIIIVKNITGEAYFPSLAINTLGDWEFRQGYKVKTITSSDLLLGCQQVDPAVTPIELPAGWSLVSYLPDYPMDAAYALSSISSNMILVKNITGASYIPSIGINTIGDMQPGQGYSIKMNNGDMLFYPTEYQ